MLPIKSCSSQANKRLRRRGGRKAIAFSIQSSLYRGWLTSDLGNEEDQVKIGVWGAPNRKKQP